MDKELWGYVHFFGQFDSLADDTRYGCWSNWAMKHGKILVHPDGVNLAMNLPLLDQIWQHMG